MYEQSQLNSLLVTRPLIVKKHRYYTAESFLFSKTAVRNLIIFNLSMIAWQLVIVKLNLFVKR